MTDAQQEQQNSCSIESKENQTGLPERKIYLNEHELKKVIDEYGTPDTWTSESVYDAEWVESPSGEYIDLYNVLAVLKELNSQNEYHKNMAIVMASQIHQLARVIQAQKDALAYCGVGLAEEKVMPS